MSLNLLFNFIYKTQQSCSTFCQSKKLTQYLIMKFIKSVIVLQIILISSTDKVHCQNESMYVEAISQVIISDEFLTGEKTVHFTRSAEKLEHKYFFDNIATQLAKRMKFDVAYRYQDAATIVKFRNKLSANVIFLSNLENFYPILVFIEKNYFVFKGFYLIVFYDETSFADIQKILNIMWNQQIVNVNVLVHRKLHGKTEELQMYTYFPFNEFVCGKVQPILINKFNENSFSTPPPFYKPKLINFYKCPIKIATFKIPPKIMLEDLDGKIQLRGIDGNLMSIIAEKLSFDIEPIIAKDLWGFNYGNGTITGASGLIVDGKADLTIGKFGMVAARNAIMKPSVSYYSSSVVIVVPIGRPFSEIEKLSKPFEIGTWSSVFGLLIFAIAIIAFIKWKLSKPLQRFIMGSKTTTPYFNIIVASIGQNLTSQVPRRNFSRFLLCILILYGLVMRSAYTGALFKFMHLDNDHHPSIKTVSDMKANDFKFYMTASAQSLIVNISQIYDGRIIYEKKDEDAIYRKMMNPETKAGIIMTKDQALFINKIKHSEYFLNFIELYHLNYVIYTKQHTFWKLAIDELLLRIAASGLYVKVETEYVQSKYMKMETHVEEGEPEPLTLDQLMGCFMILVFGILSSVCLFVIEISLPKLKLMWNL